MLVLKRRLNEVCVCGEGENRVLVTVVKIGCDSVKLGFSAMKNVPIHRAEVAERIQKQKDGTL